MASTSGNIQKKLPPAGLAVVDPKTGLMNRIWYGFFMSFISNALVDAGGLGYVVNDTTGLLARQIVAGSTRIDITNGSGIAGNTQIDVNQGNLTLAESQITGLVADLAGKQPLDTELTALATTTSAADTIPYFTGSGTATTTSFTATARSLIDDTSVGAMRTTLGFADGTYTPTLTNVTNIASSTAYPGQYLRVGNTVNVSGRIDITTSAIGVASELGMSLPIASNVSGTNFNVCAGAANANAFTLCGAILADPSNTRARIQFLAVTLSSSSFYYDYTYLIN